MATPKQMKRLAWAILVVLGVVEIGVRVVGWTDFPVYKADANIGYYLAPSQRGRFENKNEWKVNEEGLLADAYTPGKKKDIFLVGDSIVLGGNLIDHSNRLGTLLQKKGDPKWNVWPGSAGGWSVMNEIAFLEAKRKVLSKMDGLIWVLNSGDFIGPSPWQSDRVHPRRRPIFATWYLFDKYVWGQHVESRLTWLRSASANPMVSSQPTDFAFDSWDEYNQKLKTQNPRLKRVIVWYPDRSEMEHELPFWESLTSRIQQYAEKEGMIFINVRNDSRWKIEHYRDQIHPTVQGNEVLAQIIAEKTFSNF